MRCPLPKHFSGRIRLAGICLALGLTITAVTLFWRDPLSFVVHASFGLFLVIFGILLFLWTIARQPTGDGPPPTAQ